MDLMLGFLSGALVSAAYFFALWRTVRRAFVATHPVLLLAGSLVARLGLLLCVFHVLVTRGDGAALLAALIGFSIVRWGAISLARPEPGIAEMS